VRECRQGEVVFKETAKLVNKCLPHKAARRVVREWEVESLVEELLEFLLAALVWLGRARDNGDTCLVSDPLGSPLGECFLDTFGVAHIIFLCLALSLLLLFLRWPNLLGLIDVDD